MDGVETLIQSGFEVTVCVPEPGPMVAILEEIGAKVSVFPYHVLRKGDLRPKPLIQLAVKFPREAWRLKRLLLETKADLLYVNGLPFAVWFAAGRLAGLPTLGHLHEAEDQLSKMVSFLLTLPMNAADRVIANSCHSAGWLVSLQPGLKSRTSVIHNGFNFPAEDTGYEGFTSPCRLLVLGRINNRKGQAVAVQSVRLLVDRGHDVHLRIVGAPFRGYEEVLDSLQELVRELRLTECVTFVGEVADPQVEFRNADIVLVPSLLESFGNVAIEAMAHSRPVVASRIKGLSEIIEDEISGLLCEPGDAGALAEAIERLLTDPAFATRLGRSGYSYAHQRFDIRQFRLRFVSVICEFTK